MGRQRRSQYSYGQTKGVAVQPSGRSAKAFNINFSHNQSMSNKATLWWRTVGHNQFIWQSLAATCRHWQAKCWAGWSCIAFKKSIPRSFGCLFVLVMLFMHPVWFAQVVNCWSQLPQQKCRKRNCAYLAKYVHPRSVDCIFVMVMLFIQPVWFVHVGYMGHSCLSDIIVNQTAPTLPNIYTHVQLIAFLSLWCCLYSLFDLFTYDIWVTAASAIVS